MSDAPFLKRFAAGYRSFYLIRVALFAGIFAFSVHAETVIYSQGFESNDGGYTHSGSLDRWEWGTPSAAFTTGPAAAHNGAKCWGTDLDADVPLNSDMYLNSPAIPLPAITANQVLRVRFFAWISVDDMYDRGEFLVSRNGSTWETKAELLQRMQGGWNEYYFNISNYSGGNVYLQFRCRADGNIQTDPMAGLYVDDIAIFLADAPAVKTTLTFEGWEDPATFASCPWLYPWNGTEFVKDNDVYSTARGTSKRYTDFYRLGKPLIASNGKYLLNLCETDDEESYTDMVRLITVDHSPGTQITSDADGRIFCYAAPSAPVVATDKAGSDILGAVITEDSIGAKVYNGDYVDLDFSNLTISGSAIFVLRARGFLNDGTPSSFINAPRPLLTVQTLDSNGVWRTEAFFIPAGNLRCAPTI